MKKLFAAITLSACLLTLFGCGGTSPAGQNDGTNEASGTQRQDTAATSPQSETPSGSDSGTAGEPASTETASEDDTLDVLFLGNSLMYYNDMPQIFESVARGAGKKVSVTSVTLGSATMSDFASESTEVGAQAIPLLKNRKWDYLVIEPSRRISPYEETVKNAEFESAAKLKALADAAGATTVLYAVWGNNNGTVVEYKAASPTSISEAGSHTMSRAAHTKFMEEISAELSQKLGGVPVAHAGYAFENFISANRTVNLYHTDERHPSPDGSFLAACVIYATVFGESPDGTSYTMNLSSEAESKAVAASTVLEGKLPDFSEDPAADRGFNLLIVGSNLMDDYACATVFSKLFAEADGKTVVTRYVRSSTFVINDLVSESGDLGLRAALAETEWDAIIIQMTRRITKSSADVQKSEHDALASVIPLLKAETENIFIFTLNSKSKPSIFRADTPGYTDTGSKESYSAAEGSAFFKELADSWAAEFGIGVINYGQAYLDYANPEEAGLGYLQACMIYSAVFGKQIPEGLSERNGLSAELAGKLREIAAKYMPAQTVS
ncbi:MAG: hypothetical protein J6V01_05595 [Clostridia bacterium]|nr:hypothetical protein [Clostridia bacterium]